MEMTLDLSQGLSKFIQSLVEKGSFASVEAFLDYAAHVIADLYGYSESVGGKSLTSALASVLPTAPAASRAPAGPSPEEAAVLGAFTSKLELEEALYMNHAPDASRPTPLREGGLQHGCRSLNQPRHDSEVGSRR